MAATYTDNGTNTPNGSHLEFTYTFPVILSTDVKVSLNGVTQATTKYTVSTSPAKITFNNTSVDSTVQESTGAPKTGVTVRVYRETAVGKNTGDEDPKAVFAAGSSVRATDLNSNFEQVLFAAHEKQNQPILAEDIDTDAVTTAKIKADAITGAKIADDQIDSEHYAADSIDSEHYAPGSVDATALATDAVITAKIQDDAVTTDKLANSINTAINANTAKTGNATHTGEVTGATALTIADNAVVTDRIANANVTLAKVENVTNGQFIVGNGSNRPTAVAMSGDATLGNDGSVTIASDAVEIGMIGCEQTTLTDSDSHLPTSGAVVDYVAAQIAPIGGLEVIATDAVFPNTQPASGVVISIADAGGLVVNGSGVSTTGRTVGGSTVTINNIASNFNNTTVDAGVAMMVSSTGSGQIYNYHKATLKEADLLNLSGDINDFAERYKVHNFGSGNPSNPDEGDLAFDTAANKMKVYDGSAWGEVASTGEFKFLVPVNPGTTTAADWGNTGLSGGNSGTSWDLKESTNSGSAAAITSALQLLVSVNGVVQKANTGSWSGSGEGFYLQDADTIRFATAPAAGSSVFVIQIGAATTLNVPADNSVSGAKIAMGSDASGDIIYYNGTDYARLAKGSDGEILKLASGVPSWAADAGLSTEEVQDIVGGMVSSNTETNIAVTYDDTNGKLNFASTDTNTQVGGATGVDFNDNIEARFGTGNDITIDHTGTLFQVADGGLSNASSMWISTASNDGIILANNRGVGNSYIARFSKPDGCKLYHDASQKLATSATGITVTGTVAATAYTGDGSGLTGLAAGATGGNSGANAIFWENEQTVTHDYTIGNNKNAGSFGPITINSGVTVTVGAGENWTVV